MKAEAYYFAGVALFFLITGGAYFGYSHDPAGRAVLAVSFLMASLIAFFLFTQYRRRGTRPEDRTDGEIMDRAGPLDFFPPRSVWPVVTAAGSTMMLLGIVYALWLFLLGFAVLGYAAFRFVFQYVGRDR